MNQCGFTRACYSPHDSRRDGNLGTFFVCRSTSLGADFNLLGGVVQDADADVIEAEILLDMPHNLCQHLLGILAGDGRLRDAVQKSELARAALLFPEKACVL